MNNQAQDVPNCANCALRKDAEANPKSFKGRLWFWHTKWCPGWKKYQNWLAQQEEQGEKGHAAN